MSDCIDRELLKSKIRAAFPSLEDRCRINEIVNGVPAADVVPVVHGRWLWTERGPEDWEKYYVCSNCGEYTFWQTNYCQNCGAKMDLEEDER